MKINRFTLRTTFLSVVLALFIGVCESVEATALSPTIKAQESQFVPSNKGRAKFLGARNKKILDQDSSISGIAPPEATPGKVSICNQAEVRNTIEKLSESASLNTLLACKTYAIPLLINALHHQRNWESKVILVYALGKMGLEAKIALPDLIEVLNDENFKVRYAAAKALGDIKSQDAIPDLTKALKDKNENVRYGAIQALEQIDSQSEILIPSLIEAMKDDNWFVKSGSSRILRRMGATAVPYLIQVLHENDDTTFSFAVDNLSKIGAGAISYLIEALKETNPRTREGVIVVLEATAPQSIPALSQALQSENKLVRQGAAQTLGKIGLKYRSIIPVLIQSLNDPSIRVDVVTALSAIGSSAVPDLVNAFKNGTLETREGIAQTLARIKPKDQSAVPALIQALQHEPSKMEAIGALSNIGLLAVPNLIKTFNTSRSIAMRSSIAQVLAKIKPRDRSAVPALIQALKDESWLIHQGASEALIQIGSEAIPPLLVSLRQENRFERTRNPQGQAPINPLSQSEAVPPSNNAFKDRIVWVLGNMGEQAIPLLIKALTEKELILDVTQALKELKEFSPRAQSAIPTLITLLKNDNEDIRSNAIKILGNIGVRVIPSLIAALQDENAFIRSGAAQSIAQIGEQAYSATPALITLLNDKDPNIQSIAQKALSAIGEGATSELIKALQSDNKEIRKGAVITLGEIGLKARTAVPALIEELLSENEDVKLATSQSLVNIGSAAVPDLIKALRDSEIKKNHENFSVIAQILGTIASPKAHFVFVDSYLDTPWATPVDNSINRDSIPALVSSVPMLLDK